MIGYYVHHHGQGHVRRATAIVRELGDTAVTALSSLPRPDDWLSDWIQLARDDEATEARAPVAGGRFHWVPQGDPGLRTRMAQIAEWIARAAPSAMVADVSVEVAVLARLHGVPVISIGMPGVRRDAPHGLGYGISEAVICAWPAWADGMLTVDVDDRSTKFRTVGAISATSTVAGRAPDGRMSTVVVLGGSGGGGMPSHAIESAREQTPGVEWIEVGTSRENRVEQPEQLLRTASLVVSHTGQGAIADISAARVPALLVPQERPFGEQAATARVLGANPDLPVIVRDRFALDDWPDVLRAAGTLDGRNWQLWNDGGGARRAAAVIRETTREAPGES